MESMEDSPHCDYLRTHIAPYTFTNELAELVHINDQISSLDNHISELNELRRGLHRRSCHLHNVRSPAYMLPAEILSYIFQYSVDPGTDSLLADFETYSTCLRQALALSSVSTYLRQVALGTPELWKRIPLKIFNLALIDTFASLLQRCTAYAPYICVSVWEALDEEEAPLVIETLLTSDITRKIRAFELKHFESTANLWIKRLQVCSPMLEAFSLKHEEPASINEADDEGGLTFDLSSLNTVTRVVIRGPYLVLPIIVPPSVQVLQLYNVPKEVQLSLVYQCPNLMECLAITDREVYAPSSFLTPLTLHHLKRLTWEIARGLETVPSVQNLHLPSLEFLQIHHHYRENLDGVRLLCYNASATLTTLIIYTISNTLEYDDLRQLFRISFPKLVNLGISSTNLEPFLNVIRALAPNEEECNNRKPQHLPSLRFLILACNYRIEPRLLLDLFTKWGIGEASYFHVKVKSLQLMDEDWSPALREELRTIVGNRRLEVTWHNTKIQQLYAKNSLVEKIVED